MKSLRNRSLLFVLCIAFLLFGCHKDDEGAGTPPILTLQVDAQRHVVFDNRIFATNDAGEVLDIKSFSAGETVMLFSDKASDRINVTFFSHDTTSSGLSIFQTFASVPRGTVLNLNVSGPSTLQPGKATFKISNYTFGSSGNYGFSTLDFSNGNALGMHTTFYNNETDMDISFFGVPSDFLMTAYRTGVPVYSWARGVQDGDIIKRDFDSDFAPFPHQRKLDFEGETFCGIYGTDANSNFVRILDTYQFSGTAFSYKPTVGYIDGFVSYDIEVVNDQPNGEVEYRSSGAPDLSFTMPTFNFSLHSKGMQDLSFSFSEDYTFYSSSWNYQQGNENIRWDFSAPAGEPVRGLSIPNEIAAKYPQINMSKFVHSNLNLTMNIEGVSYLENIPGFTATSDQKNRKLYSFTPRL